MLPQQLLDEMALLSYQLVRITHGAAHKQWNISLPEGVTIRPGAPVSAQPPLLLKEDNTPIDPAFPISVQVLDPLERGGNNHAAARRRLIQWMTRAGFTETEFSEAPHSMHLVFVSEKCSLPIADWLSSVTPIEPDYELETIEDQSGPRSLENVQLPDVSFSHNPTPPPSTRLDEIEQRWKLRLPDDYYAFLLKYNGGVPQPAKLKLTLRGGETELKILQFLSVFPQEQFSPYDLEAALETQSVNLPKHLLPLAYCQYEGEPQLLCLAFNGDERGKVFLFEPYADDPCQEIAGSLSELLAQLE